MSTGTSELLHSEGSGIATDTVLTGEERQITARSPLQLFWRRFRRDKVAMAALGFIILLVLVAIFAPLIVKAVGAPDPNTQSDDGARLLRPAVRAELQAPLRRRPDRPRRVRPHALRRAHLAHRRVDRHALIVLIGMSLGMIAGFYRGWTDSVLSRIMDVLLAFPVLLLRSASAPRARSAAAASAA